jgi:hypothetical protein
MTPTDEDIPTSPELPLFVCPECLNKPVPCPCTVCLGERYVTNSTLRKWNLEHGRRPTPAGIPAVRRA